MRKDKKKDGRTGHLSVVGEIILKEILKEWNGTVWSGLTFWCRNYFFKF